MWVQLTPTHVDKKTYGVNIGEELTEKIEAPLEYGDHRSERIRNLIRMGLAAESALEKRHMVDTLSMKEKEDLIKQAVFDELADEDGPNGQTASS